MVRFILNSGSEKEIKSSFTNQEAPIDMIEPLELRDTKSTIFVHLVEMIDA